MYYYTLERGRREELSQHVDREFGKKFDEPEWQTAVLWGFIGWVVLRCLAGVYSIGAGASELNELQQEVLAASAILIGFSRYCYVRHMNKRWYRRFDELAARQVDA